MNNIYIQTLKLGFDNPKGISFDEVVERLKIDFTDNSFKTNYTIWFYAHFFNNKAETKVIGNTKAINPDYRINANNIDSFSTINKQKSYIKGDAVNKYIDYLELERTRESSKQASLFATGSLIIAILAVMLPYFISPDKINNSGRIVLVSILLTIAAGIYSAIDIAKVKQVKNSKFWFFSIIITVLSVAVSYFATLLVNKLVADSEWWLQGIAVLPVFVFWLGQIIKRKYQCNKL